VAKRRTYAKDRAAIKVVQELIDETPVRVRLTKRQSEIEEAHRNGYSSGKAEAARLLQKQYLDALSESEARNAQQLQQHKAAQVNLVHTFASVIFMLGKGEGGSNPNGDTQQSKMDFNYSELTDAQR